MLIWKKIRIGNCKKEFEGYKEFIHSLSLFVFNPFSTNVFSNTFVPGVCAFPHTPKKNYYKSINSIKNQFESYAILKLSFIVRFETYRNVLQCQFFTSRGILNSSKCLRPADKIEQISIVVTFSIFETHQWCIPQMKATNKQNSIFLENGGLITETDNQFQLSCFFVQISC